MRPGNEAFQSGSLPAGETSWQTLLDRLSACEEAIRGIREEQIRRRGLTPAEFLLLADCRNAGSEGRTGAELASRTQLSKLEARALIRELRERQLLESRRRRGQDRRTYWRVTRGGCRAIDEIHLELAESTLRLHQVITQAEVERGTELLARIEELVKGARG